MSNPYACLDPEPHPPHPAGIGDCPGVAHFDRVSAAAHSECDDGCLAKVPEPWPAPPVRHHLGEAPLPGLAEEVAHENSPGRSFRELSETGLLWLINAVVFHPRGFALALSMDTLTGEVTGWDLLGDGMSPYRYASDMDARFLVAEETLAEYRHVLDQAGGGTNG